jgi:hypothetical protein
MSIQPDTPFSGIFFCVTARSIYEVNLQARDPVSECGNAPILRKVAMRPGSNTHNGRTVPWYVRGKFHLAITPDGIKRYSINPHQRESTGRIPLPDISTVDPKLRALGTGPIVGLFLRRDEADSCLEHSEFMPVFELLWLRETTDVLAQITGLHPLISISIETQKLIAARADQAAKSRPPC